MGSHSAEDGKLGRSTPAFTAVILPCETVMD